MKRIISLLLAAVITLSLAGCTGSDVRTYTEPTETPAETDSAADAATEAPVEETPSIDYTAAYETYAPDTVVAVVNGEPVYWDEYFYWMQEAITLVNYYYGEITDWNAACTFDSTLTYAEYVRDYADDTVRMYRAMEEKAEEMGITLTEEDNAYLDELWQSDIDSIGGEEELLARLDELFLTRDIYYYINTVSLTADKVFTEQFGEAGEKLSEEEVIEYGEYQSYMRVKHILYKTTDAEENALSEEEIAEKLAAAQDAVTQLRAVEDIAEREALFDELMNEHSEDTGKTAYPDGYCFTMGDMVDIFYTTSMELEEYEISEPVESSYGYHVIIRLPLRPEDIPISDGVNSLRSLAATEMFNSNVASWVEETELVFEEGFEALDLSELFKVA